MGDFTTLKKASSCSTIYIDDSTVSQPNLKNTIKCVSLAIYYHIKNRHSDTILDIFDERKQPLTREVVTADYDKYNPDHRQIYKFIRTLFNAAQLTAECAIITLVYLERLLTYAEVGRICDIVDLNDNDYPGGHQPRVLEEDHPGGHPPRQQGVG